jgi:hypothetical protein
MTQDWKLTSVRTCEKYFIFTIIWSNFDMR